jgi:D-beta-D-heptose 7-phosphate kinase/D-beta-D-heptose 1-phosphate adenosyltransferase
MNQLIQRQFEFKSKIAVVGDSIVDEYYDVIANKISPEFPVPILNSLDDSPKSLVLGGASNVCAQLSNFNFDVSLFSLINERLKYKTNQIGINTDGCIFSKSVPIKKRYYSNGFPLCRIDVEGEGYNYNQEQLSGLQEKIFQNFFSSGPFDVVIFSDYNKGLFFNIKNIIKSIGKETITIVDPKKSPIDRWEGCTIIKPNYEEAMKISGFDDPLKQSEYFLKKTNCQAVVITKGGEGVFVNVMGSWHEYTPESKKTARSVIGAGDCFVAFLGMCMAHSIDIKKAIELSFKACSLYVNNIHNFPLFPYQIEDSKFVFPRSLENRDFVLSFINGCFDILHPGHIELFKFAKSKSDKLVVALNSDDSVKRQKKVHGLINDLEFRKTMISALEYVDFVVDFDEDNPIEIIKQIKPDLLIKGSDHKDCVESNLFDQVFILDRLKDYSTTNLFEKISCMMAK